MQFMAYKLLWNFVIVVFQSKWSPLHTLSLAGQIPFMDRLLENGLNIDLVDKVTLFMSMKTAIHYFCLCSFSSSFFTHFPVAFMWVNLVKQDGLTALHKSIIGKKEAVTSHLLRKGASIHARDLVGHLLYIINLNPPFVSLCYRIYLFILIIGWCHPTSLCSSSRRHANCEVTNQI